MLFVIIGPPGVGKSFLVNELITNHADLFTLWPVITTRPNRDGTGEPDRQFVSWTDYADLKRSQSLYLSGTYDSHSYGWLRPEPSDKAHITNAWPEILPSFIQVAAIPVVLLCDDRRLLRRRLHARGDSPELIKRRLRIIDALPSGLGLDLQAVNARGKSFTIQGDETIDAMVIPWMLRRVAKANPSS